MQMDKATLAAPDVFSPVVQLFDVRPKAEAAIVLCARLSSARPSNDNLNLILHLLKKGHWSPFEMTSMAMKVTTTRDISRQIIRHRSFNFQEFSQRYQKVNRLQNAPALREARMQHKSNRQSSTPTNDMKIKQTWEQMQQDVWNTCFAKYKEAIAMGIAREQARALLPEGLTKTTIVMHGTVRSWMHYLMSRTEEGTQKEHRDIANKVMEHFCTHFPTCAKAMGWTSTGNDSPSEFELYLSQNS